MKTLAILALKQTDGIGDVTIRKILSLPGEHDPQTPKDLLDLLKKARGAKGRIYTPKIENLQHGWVEAERVWEVSKQRHIKIISPLDNEFPQRLKDIPESPVLLHVMGNMYALKCKGIAIVGTRRASEFGIQKANELAASFVRKGYVINSGLAEGIDSAAHRGALDAGGITVAVLAHGLDIVFPVSNRALADEILLKKGALVSEYPLGTGFNKGNFIRRDRIQSGLSLGTFVVETGVVGGTMHTVSFTLKQGRPLFVLKHPTDFPTNQQIMGNQMLIDKGKVTVVYENDTQFQQVLEALTKGNQIQVNPKVEQKKIKKNKKNLSTCPKLEEWD